MIRGIHIASSELRFNREGPEGAKLPSMRKGEIVEARVVRLLSPGRAQLMISGRKVVADTSIPLSPGEVIRLKAAGSGGLQIMKLIPSDETIGRNSLLSLISSLPREPFSGLAKFMTSLFQKDGTAASSPFPGNAIAGGGASGRLNSGAMSAFLGGLAPGGEVSPSIKADLTALGEALLSISLQSDQPDLEFLPRLLSRCGLMLERNLAKFVRHGLSPSGKDRDIQPAAQDMVKFDNSEDLESRDKAVLKPESGTGLKSGSPGGVKSGDQPGFKAGEQTSAPAPAKVIQEDVKGLALKLLGELKGDKSDPSGVLKEFSENMEKMQIINHHTSETGRYVIPFPIFDESGFRFGQFLFDRGDPSRDQADSGSRLIKASVFLDMSRLGAVRADLAFLNKDVSGTIEVSDEEIRHYIVSRLPELEVRLKIHGFNLSRMTCRVRSRQELEQASLFNEVLNQGEGVLNIVI